MTVVKICGITSARDARLAVDAGADALGFIAVPGSVRCVTPAEFKAISVAVPVKIRRVIVVQKPEDATAYGADNISIQYYEEEAEEAVLPWDAAFRIRAFRMRGPETLCEIASSTRPAGALLLDTYHKDLLGGSGETFNWDLAREAKLITALPVYLAGGLTPGNVQQALDACQPDGVDVSSGVELSPGVKDEAKVRSFVYAVREWDARNKN